MTEPIDYDKLWADYTDKIDADFIYCVEEVMRLREFTMSDVQYDIADWVVNGPKKRGIIAWRGVAKTDLIAIYLLWRLRKDPNTKCLLVSKSDAVGKDTLNSIKGLIEVIPFFQCLVATPGMWHRNSTTQYDVGPSKQGGLPSITVCGIEGNITGKRCHILIMDDVETLMNTITLAQREKLATYVQEPENILFPNYDVIYLGTYHHEDSLYLRLCKMESNIKGREADSHYHFRSWPVLYPKPSEVAEIPFLAPFFQERLADGRARAGEPVWPERFDFDHIASLALSKTTFTKNWMMMPKLTGDNRYPLRHSDLIVFNCDRYTAPKSLVWGMNSAGGSTVIEELEPIGMALDRFYRPAMISQEWERLHGTKAFLDPAGMNTKKKPDEMAWAIVGQLNGLLHAKHVEGIYGGASYENLEYVVKSLREHDARELYIEKNFGGEMLIQLIQPIITKYTIKIDDNGQSENKEFPYGWSCTVIPVHNSQAKEQRIIDTLEPVFASHRLVVDAKLAQDTTLMFQLTRITREKGCLEHDDRVDALASCVAEWKDYLDQDAIATVARNEQELANQRVADYLKRLGLDTIADHESTLQSYEQHRRFYA